MVPNRREPFTIEMHLAIAKNLPSTLKDDCCLTAAMAYWTLCNLYAGCRGIKWAQAHLIQRPLNTFHRNCFQNAYAFTLNDILCFTITSAPLTFAQTLAAPTQVQKSNCDSRNKRMVRTESGNCSYATAAIRTSVSCRISYKFLRATND